MINIETPTYYTATKKYNLSFPTLEQDIDADVVVIGGGFSGINTALELTTQFGPPLAQTRHIEIKLGLDLLLQTGATIDAIIAQANIQRTDGPGLTGALGLGLQHRRQAAQTALEVEIGIQLQTLVFK